MKTLWAGLAVGLTLAALQGVTAVASVRHPPPICRRPHQTHCVHRVVTPPPPRHIIHGIRIHHPPPPPPANNGWTNGVPPMHPQP